MRNGRVRSTARLRAQALTELATIAEDAGNADLAGQRLTEAMTLMSTQYPSAVATSAAKARYAGFLARHGQRSEALELFAEVVDENSKQASPRAGLENRLAPYFELLLGEMESNPSLVSQFFLASETLVRPGVANTQAVLARELAGGNDEASRLFRESVTLSRSIESARVQLARLQGLEAPDDTVPARIESVQQQTRRSLRAANRNPGRSRPISALSRGLDQRADPRRSSIDAASGRSLSQTLRGCRRDVRDPRHTR